MLSPEGQRFLGQFQATGEADVRGHYWGTITNPPDVHELVVSIAPEEFSKMKPGVEYSYVMKAEMMRDGKPVVAEKKVSFKAGETTEVSLDMPATGVAAR